MPLRMFVPLTIRLIACAAIAAGLLATVPTPPAHAQSTEAPTERALELAREFIALMLEKDLSRRMSADGWARVEQRLKDSNKGIEKKVLEDLQTEYTSLQFAMVSELVENAPPVYAKYFTEQELEAIKAFHESEVGQKMISTLPLIINEVMQQVVVKTQQVGPVVEQLFEKAVSDRGFKIDPPQQPAQQPVQQ